MKSRKLLFSLIAFFLVMVIFTAVSGNIYYDSLAVVAVGESKKDTLTANYSNTATIEYEKRQNHVYAEFSFSTVKLLAQNGRWLEKQDPLYSVPVDEVLLLQKNAELAVYQLTEQNKAISPNGRTQYLKEGNKLQYEINSLQIDELERQITYLKTLYKNKGVVNTETKGVVQYFLDSGEPVGQGREIAAVTRNSTRGYVKWQVPPEQGALFGIDSRVEAMLLVADASNKVQLKSHELKISGADPLPQGQGTVFRAEIPTGVTLAMEEGMVTTVNSKYVSIEVYSHVVPKQAIVFEDGSTNRGFIYGVMSRDRVYGKEYYVVPFYVEVLRTIDNNAAVVNVPSDCEIVFETTKPLYRDMAVKLNVPE